MNEKLSAKRSQKQLEPLGLFIETLFQLGGYATWKEFADDAGITAPQVSDFKNAVAEPAGLNLLRLIEAAARRGEGDSDAVATAVRSLPPDPLAALVEVVAELAHDQALILDALDVPDSERGPRGARSRLPQAAPMLDRKLDELEGRKARPRSS